MGDGFRNVFANCKIMPKFTNQASVSIIKKLVLVFPSSEWTLLMVLEVQHEI
jgi:hypothetical protein